MVMPMTANVSLYTVIALMIGALALVCLVVRQALKGREAVGWVALGLIGGVGTTLVYSMGGSGPFTMASLAILDTLSVACACFAIRAALDRRAIPRRVTVAAMVLLAVSVLAMLADIASPFLAAIPFQLGMFLLLATTVRAAFRSLHGAAEWSMFIGISMNLATYAVRMPFWPSLMDAGRAYPSLASPWLNLFMLATSSLFVPLVVLGIIGREIGWLVGDYRDRSERDGMTGLHNRTSFQARFGQMKAAEGVLVLADIDHFKTINDRYGHHVGDKVIQAFADLIGEARGIAGRVGGEEFALAMPGASVEQARGDVEALRREFHALRMADIDHDHFLSASFGIAAYRSGDSYSRIFADADAALYDAKTRGRNKTVVAGGAVQGPAAQPLQATSA